MEGRDHVSGRNGRGDMMVGVEGRGHVSEEVEKWGGNVLVGRSEVSVHASGGGE